MYLHGRAPYKPNISFNKKVTCSLSSQNRSKSTKINRHTVRHTGAGRVKRYIVTRFVTRGQRGQQNHCESTQFCVSPISI